MANEQEVWKDIPGFSRYKVSTSGGVWDSKTATLLQTSINGGFKRCRLYPDGSQSTAWFKVHRLVAITYIEKPEGVKKVSMLDGDKLNTDVNNLFWYVVPTKEPKIRKKKVPLEKKVKPYPRYKLQRFYRAIEQVVKFCLSVQEERREYMTPITYSRCPRIMDIPWERSSKSGSYRRWTSIWHRVGRNKAYLDVSIHKDWIYYSNFKSWWEENYVEGYQMDKDIRSSSYNREYGPTTCCFLPSHLNTTLSGTFITDGLTGARPTYNGKYCSILAGQSLHLGTYNTEIEAHMAWLSAKRVQIVEVSDMYYLPANARDGVSALLSKIDFCLSSNIPLLNYGSKEFL